VNNDVFEVAETLGFGVLGYILIALGFQPAPILVGFVLGPRLEENFRRAMILSRGDLGTFIAEPISAVLLLASFVMLGPQLWVRLRRGRTMKVATVGFGADC
jgi:putative tricarboxylic transport membrane protein